MAKFPDRLWSLRTAACMTQQELADTINTSRRAVAYWESGKVQPTSESIVLLAVYFNVSADYLLGLTDQKKTIA
jgi:transcriptional regulator with XRE-family HTH domain